MLFLGNVENTSLVFQTDFKHFINNDVKVATCVTAHGNTFWRVCLFLFTACGKAWMWTAQTAQVTHPYIMLRSMDTGKTDLKRIWICHGFYMSVCMHSEVQTQSEEIVSWSLCYYNTLLLEQQATQLVLELKLK